MKKLACCLAIPLLAACSSVPDTSGIGSSISSALDISPYLHPYRIDVRQGNMVTQEMVAQLKPGLTKDQVRFVLGTPLLTDVFHADRWDYVYRLQKGDGEVQHRRFVVFFEDGKLARVDGDVVAESGGAETAAAKPATRMIEIKGPQPKADEAPQPKPEEANKPEVAKVAAPAPAVSQ
ncbi:MAG: outer membrane protein assembly factor BamE [Rhodocyclaceae bacterium]|nr:outer membrane protein assembly factor BamE [Rhodocyclaceae bacterium]